MRSVLWLSLLVLLAGCGGAGSSTISSETSTTPTNTKVFAYAGAQYTDQINAFELNKTTGELIPLSQPSIPAQALPMISTVLPGKKFLVSANYSGHSISTYSINQTTGNLSLVAHTSLGAGIAPAWIISHPSLPVAYVAESGQARISIIDFDANGGATIRTTVPAGSGVTALEMNKAGTILYSVDQNVNQLSIYSIGGTGALTSVTTASTPASSSPNHAALDPSGKFLYVANWGTANVSAYAVSGTNLSLINTVAAGTGGVYMVAPSPDGSRLFATKPYGHNYAVMDINQTTGDLTVASTPALTGSVNFSFYKDFAFAVRWANNPGLAIETRAYTASGGLGTTALSSSGALRGLYKLNLVEIDQP